MATSLSSATWSPRQWFATSPRPPAPCPITLATSYQAVSMSWRLPPGPPTSRRRPAPASGQVGPAPGKTPGDSRVGVGGGPEPRANVMGSRLPRRVGAGSLVGPPPARLCPAHPPLAPVPPAQLALCTLGTRALRASWYSSGGAAWLHLLLTDLLSGSNLTAGVARGVSSHTFPCLSPGTPYTLTVSAVAGPHWAVGPSATEWTRECCWGFAGHCRVPSAKWADPAMRVASRVLQGKGEARGCPPAGWW